MLQPQIDNAAHALERRSQFTALRLGRVRVLFTASGHLLANQPLAAFLGALKQFKALHQFRIVLALPPRDCKNDRRDARSSEQPGQRIEQRIGRCHRYGQAFDVVVINFVNERLRLCRVDRGVEHAGVHVVLAHPTHAWQVETWEQPNVTSRRGLVEVVEFCGGLSDIGERGLARGLRYGRDQKRGRYEHCESADYQLQHWLPLSGRSRDQGR